MGCGISKSVRTVSYAHIPPSARSQHSTTSTLTPRGSHGAPKAPPLVDNQNNNTNTTHNLEQPEKISKVDFATNGIIPKARKYADIYREKTEGSPWSSDSESEGEDERDVLKLMLRQDSKSIGDTRSTATSRTVLTTALQSATSRRTRSTYLDRELSHTLHDPLYDGGTFTSQAPVEEEDGDKSSPLLEVVPQLPLRPAAVYDGNHFWWPNKRVLLPVYRRVLEVDELAKRVPMEKNAGEVVTKIRRFCEEEVEVARAVYTWIRYHLTYLPKGQFTDDPIPVKVLEKGKGNAMALSALYQYMCELAGIEGEVVRGISKRPPYQPGSTPVDALCSVKTKHAHAWNKVRLGGRWYIVDLSPSSNLCGCEHHHLQGSVDTQEEQFLAKPQDFLPTHLPMYILEDQLEVDLENQLVGDNYCVLVEAWEPQALRTTTAHEWGIKPLSHQLGVINTAENEVWVQFMCPNVMEYHVCLTSTDGKGKKHEGFTLIYLQEDIITAYVRLPGTGVYAMKIYASPTYIKPHTGSNGCKLAMMYTIHATGKMSHEPFSKTLDGLWGLTPLLFDTGCRVLSTKGAEITAIGGAACIDIRLPTAGLCPNVVWFCKARREKENLSGYVYAEREGRLTRLHLICPDKGEYIVEVKFPIETNDNVMYNLSGKDYTTSEGGVCYAYARFFITCPGTSTLISAFPCFPASICGPQVALAKYELSLPRLHGSTLYPVDGQCEFILHQERPVEVFHALEAEGGVILRNFTQWIYAERNGYDVTYNIKIPKAGRYKITLTCKEQRDEEPEFDDTWDEQEPEVVCVFMIDSPDAYMGDLYPANQTVWGVTNSFHQLGLCSDWEEISSLEVNNGCAFCMIRTPPDVHLCPKLYHVNDLSFDLTENRINYLNDNEVHFNIALSFKGHYKLEIWQGDVQIVATYLLYCDQPIKPFIPYESFWSGYGKHSGFSNLGIKEITNPDDQGPIRLATEGKCLIKQVIPKGLHVRFMLVHDGVVEKGSVYAELNANEVTYHIHVSNTGYSRFTCWHVPEDGEEALEDSKLEDFEEDDNGECLLFSYLILNHDGVVSSEIYPEWPQIWGLNRQGLVYGFKIRGRQSSTIKAAKGLGSLALSHPENLEVLYSLENPDLDPKDAKRSFFVEQQSETQRLISLSLPTEGKYAFKIWARSNAERHCVAVGAFLVVASDPGTFTYPTFNDMHPHTKLIEPKINPLSADNEYFFKLDVPGAKRIQLWDGKGQWRALLEQQEDGSDTISGMVNVGEPKELWVAGLYDPEFCYGNGGFRNLLMYEVV